jgi:Acyl-CoA reductase (LuxC)
MALNKSDRIEALIQLGQVISPEHDSVLKLMEEARIANPWFTESNVRYCLNNWCEALAPAKVEKWIKPIEEVEVKNVGIVMAGNIPLVGLHDLLAAIACGHNAIVKMSHNDDVLMQFVVDSLQNFNSEFKDSIKVQDQIKGVDAIIATGSNNSSRYFEYYFKNIPHVIRKNRTSVAVISGNESEEELIALSDDIFMYFGLGCRNVTKLYVPDNYDFMQLITAFDKYKYLIDHHKFANNYTYHKAIFLMNLDTHLDSGFALFKEDEGLHAPLSCVFYEAYSDVKSVKNKLTSIDTEIQLVLSNDQNVSSNRFGSAQHTSLLDYADKVDTLIFLQNI